MNIFLVNIIIYCVLTILSNCSSQISQKGHLVKVWSQCSKWSVSAKQRLRFILLVCESVGEVVLLFGYDLRKPLSRFKCCGVSLWAGVAFNVTAVYWCRTIYSYVQSFIPGSSLFLFLQLSFYILLFLRGYLLTILYVPYFSSNIQASGLRSLNLTITPFLKDILVAGLNSSTTITLYKWALFGNLAQC